MLLADDHAVVREGLRSYLEVQDGLAVVGEAADGEEAVREAERLRPDVVLMDLVMPRLDGVGAMRELRRVVPDTNIVFVTTSRTPEDRDRAAAAGADGYIVKPDSVFTLGEKLMAEVG